MLRYTAANGRLPEKAYDLSGHGGGGRLHAWEHLSGDQVPDSAREHAAALAPVALEPDPEPEHM